MFSKGQTRCKPCRADDAREARARKGIKTRDSNYSINEQRHALALEGKKLCTLCSEIKPQYDFSRNKGSWDGLAHACKDCAYSATKKWVKENRERVYIKNKRWEQRNSDKLKASKARSHRRWYEVNREEKLKKNAEWVKQNPQYTAKKRALRRSALECGEDIDLQKIKDRDVNCYLCSEINRYDLKWPDPLSPTLDHLIALANGGEHTEDNVAYTHKRCNESKGKKNIEDLD